MTKKFDIKPEHLFVVQDILNKYLQKDVIIWVFGSRAKKNTKPYSDLDLALDMNGELIDPEIISKIANDFEESDLPYKVDVLDIVTVSDKFREIIEIDKIRLYF
jgi:type I restriction enzyme S subunit